MVKSRAFGVVCLVLLFFASSAFGKPGELDLIYVNSIGGEHAAYSRSFGSIQNNPALLSGQEAALTFTGLNVGVHGPVFDIATFILGSMQASDDIFETLIDSGLLDDMNAGMSLRGPLFFGFTGEGLGFVLYNGLDVKLRDAGTLAVFTGFDAEIGIFGAYAFRYAFPTERRHLVDLGVGLKGFVRGSLAKKHNLLVLLGSEDDFMSLGYLTSFPFSLNSGVGLDVGLSYEFEKWFRFSLAAKDLATIVYTNAYESLDSFLASEEEIAASQQLLPSSLNASLRFSPNIQGISSSLSNLGIYISYNDILAYFTHRATMRNPVLNAGFGIGITLFDRLTVQAGFSDALFSAGLDLQYDHLTIYLSMFGREESMEPGLNSLYNLQLGFDLSF